VNYKTEYCKEFEPDNLWQKPLTRQHSSNLGKWELSHAVNLFAILAKTKITGTGCLQAG
jgi:hypothetical protein